MDYTPLIQDAHSFNPKTTFSKRSSQDDSGPQFRTISITDAGTKTLFPRFKYCRKHVNHLITKCQNLYMQCDLSDETPSTLADDVFALAWKNGAIPESVLQYEKTSFPMPPFDLNQILLLILPSETKYTHFFDELPTLKAILVVDGETGGHRTENLINGENEEHSGRYVIATRESTLTEDIDRTLERLVFKYLQDELKKLEFHSSEVNDLTNKQRARVQDLISMIVGMFSRSGIPECEKPPIPLGDQSKLENKRFAEKIGGAIGSADKNVVGVISRYGILQINIDEALSDDKRKDIYAKLKAKCLEHGVKEFTIRYVNREIKPLASSGDQIGRSDGGVNGTLGGFARNKNMLCALFSRHVAVHIIPETGLFVRSNGTDSVHLGSILLPLGESSMDIAAATIKKEMIHLCDTRFKNDEGRPTRCRIYDFSGVTERSIQGLSVHIWGAESKPGKGQIVGTRLYGRGVGPQLIVEDDDEHSRFCKAGDSGAIILADDPNGSDSVLAMAMVVGVFLSPGSPSQYMGLQMKDGLNDLSNTHNGEFELEDGF